ncbi:MAG: ATP-binding protein [Sedimentibacter sp.]|uniref:ATP-binding protein n=1 Tax=Sedimentibacter sp. TaxID=1960295 RepID=UPI0031581C89
MERILKEFGDRPFLLVSEGVVTETNDMFLSITGYSSKEVVGQKLEYIGGLLRVNYQLSLEQLKGRQRCYIFDRYLESIEVTVECVQIDTALKAIFFDSRVNNRYNKTFSIISKMYTDKNTGVVVLGCPEMIILKTNREYLNMLDEPFNRKAAAMGMKLNEIITGYGQSNLQEMFCRVISTGNAYFQEEYEQFHYQRGVTYWNLSMVPLHEHNKVKYIIMSILDVTRRVLERNAIVQKNKELEAIFENMSDGLFIFDKEGTYIRMNKKAREFVYNPETFRKVGDTLAHTRYADLSGKNIKLEDMPIPRIIRGETVNNFYFTRVSPDGVFHYCANGSPIYDEYGNINKGILLLKDDSDRLKYEENLYIQTQYYMLNRIITSMNLGILRISYPEFNIVDINTMFYDLLRDKHNGMFTISEMHGKNIFQCLNLQEGNPEYEQLIKVILKTKQNSTHTLIVRFNVKGEEKHFKLVFEPLFKLNNEIAEIVMLCVDITNEIAAKEQAEETLKTEEEFFINITHELKTPLNVIFSANQLMNIQFGRGLSEDNMESFRRNMDIIKQNCYRLTKLVNNIVDLSKLQSGHMTMNLEDVNVVGLVKNIVKSVSEYVEGKGLTVEFCSEAEERIIAVDPYKIERVILNLISNAIKFSDKGSKIEVSVINNEETVEIIVRDNGVGIDKNQLDMIFERFHQVDKTLSRNAEGSGVGLSLVKSIVEKHHGEISVESKVGEGSTFRIKLPPRVIGKQAEHVSNNLQHSKIEMINIEFSDIYSL